jgi:hypothetical protein
MMEVMEKTQNTSLKLFVLPQITPLSQGKFTKPYLADANAFQPCHLQTDQFAHSTNLPLPAFL